MKTDKKNTDNKENNPDEKLDSLIEKSKNENEALKKILAGIDKMSRDQKESDNKKKSKRNK